MHCELHCMVCMKTLSGPWLENKEWQICWSPVCFVPPPLLVFSSLSRLCLMPSFYLPLPSLFVTQNPYFLYDLTFSWIQWAVSISIFLWSIFCFRLSWFSHLCVKSCIMKCPRRSASFPFLQIGVCCENQTFVQRNNLDFLLWNGW